MRCSSSRRGHRRAQDAATVSLRLCEAGQAQPLSLTETLPTHPQLPRPDSRLVLRVQLGRRGEGLLLLSGREFKPWWCGTGSPTFPVRHLAEKPFRWVRLDGLSASEQLLSTFDLGSFAPRAPLFQTGYQTLLGKKEHYRRLRYRLGCPNSDARESLKPVLLDELLGSGSHREDLLFEILKAGNLEGLRELLRALLAVIPHQWRGRNRMAEHEGFYASVLYAHLSAAGADVRTEESGSAGRADLCVRVFGRVYVFEFKMQGRGGTATAMAQLTARRCADRYRALGEPIHLVAVEFSPETRNLTGFETKTI